MALSALADKSVEPTEEQLAEVLGFEAVQLWLEIRLSMEKAYPPLVQEWNYASAKSGWSCRLVQKKRRLVYLIPQQGHFLAAVVLGDKAVDRVREAGIPQNLLNELESAKKYAEGRGLRFAVRSREDVEAVKALVACKMAG